MLTCDVMSCSEKPQSLISSASDFDRASRAAARTFGDYLLEGALHLLVLQQLNVTGSDTFHLLDCVGRIFAELPQDVPEYRSGGERNRLRQPRHQKLLSHEVVAWIKLLALHRQRRQAADDGATLQPLRDEPRTSKRVRRARRDARNGKALEAERIRELDHVGWPVDDAIAFHVRRNAEPRPVNTYHAGTELLAGLIVVPRLESASRAAVELDRRLALRVTILGEAKRAAVLQDHALLGRVADSLCHFPLTLTEERYLPTVAKRAHQAPAVSKH